MIDLEGYVILVVGTSDGSIRLFGSPADRADLEIGDEILEVNGQALDGYTHAEIISHIHKCIRSKTIRLRVKRSGSSTDPSSDPSSRPLLPTDIQDAYVIAVEEQAKRRLEQLSALHKVHPVDIAQLQDVGNNNCLAHDPAPQKEEIKEKVEGHAEEQPVQECVYRADLNTSVLSMETSVINGYSSDLMMREYSSQENMYEPVGGDPGPHREMAIDVPEGFHPVKKERPHFPASHSQPGTPVRSSKPVMAENPAALTAQERQQYHERIRRYEEDLAKRREEEERLQREEEFLRTSLRGSKKLQALEEVRSRHQQQQQFVDGFVNPNYDEDEEARLEAASKASTLQMKQRQQPLDGLGRKPLGVDEVLLCLHNAQHRLKTVDEHHDLSQLAALFQSPRFERALTVHRAVVSVALKNPLPVLTISSSPAGGLPGVQGLHWDVLSGLRASTQHQPTTQAASEELQQILLSPHFKALMLCHDKVAAQKAEPPKTTTEDDEREYLYERASLYGEESIKIVRLQKSADPLGATVRNEGEAVRIGRIVKGGIAERSGLLHEGDEILEINGIDIRGKSVNDVCDLMASLTGTLTFLINPSLDQHTAQKEEQLVHIRAHFNYDPEEDIYIPCKELGISFVRGDILHIINQDDPNWWQAYREGEEDQALAGLIPSRTFQEQREIIRHTLMADGKDGAKGKKSKCNSCGRKHNKKNQKRKLYSSTGEDLDAEEILTYEEVALYYPQPNRKRPIVLIGPPNVGRQELRERLMETYPDRFGAAIPHTSRPRDENEMDGKDYHFVPRHVFEADIIEHKFVEYGEYEKHLFGTSLEAIRQVVSSGRICVLNLHPESLRVLKASDMKPYILFVAPPNIDKLRQLRMSQGVIKVTDEELTEIIEKGRELEETYGHFFDHIITNFDLDRTYDELRGVLDQLEVEPQWVPAHWVT